jgi:hypothetical protein
VFLGIGVTPLFDTESGWFGASDGFYDNEFFVTSWGGAAYRINPKTQRITMVGDGYGTPVIAELALDQRDGALYGVDYSGETSYLHVINKTSGAATLIGDMGHDEFWAMCYDRDDKELYAISEETRTLYTVDPTDGHTTAIGSGTGTDSGIYDIWYDWKSGQLFGVGASGWHYLINKDNGVATIIGTAPYAVIAGLGDVGPNKIPSLSEWGILVLTLLLIASAIWLVRSKIRARSVA